MKKIDLSTEERRKRSDALMKAVLDMLDYSTHQEVKQFVDLILATDYMIEKGIVK